jgi:tetraacyldisaccharide 4'-kinase
MHGHELGESREGMGRFGRKGWQIHEERINGLWLAFLGFFSMCYRSGVRLRLWAHRVGLLREQSLPGFVVSVGNLTVGGTGKTPAVLALGRWAHRQGYRVAILSRGYGGRYTEKVLEVTDGRCIKAGPEEAGDEPYLLAKNLPGIPIILSRKRILAGRFARARFGSDFFILDDGFQHLQVRRDLNLALMDATNPFGNGHLLPWGPLREPLDQLNRADVFVLTRFKPGGPGEKTLVSLQRKFPETPILRSDHRPREVAFPQLHQGYSPEILRGKTLVAFAGIARPAVFRETLAGLGGEVVHFKAFGDHHPYRLAEIEELIEKKESLHARYLITTEKDWVRICGLQVSCPDLGYLRIGFCLWGSEDALFEMIESRTRPRAVAGK